LAVADVESPLLRYLSTLVMKHLCTLASAVCVGSILTVGVAVAEEPVAWWSFDSVADGVVADRAAGRDDRLDGNCKLTRGAVGNALLFDGFTTVLDLILGWGVSGAALTIDGKETAGGPRFRGGHRHGLESSDLIVGIEREATEPFEMTLSPR